MKQVTRFQTFDSAEWKDTTEALRHLEKLEADRMCALAHEVAQITKYKEAMSFIDTSLEEFIYIQTIRNDKKLELPDQ